MLTNSDSTTHIDTPCMPCAPLSPLLPESPESPIRPGGPVGPGGPESPLWPFAPEIKKRTQGIKLCIIKQPQLQRTALHLSLL